MADRNSSILSRMTTLQIIDLSLYLLVAALYIPVIINALRGHEGHQTVHYLLGVYAFVGLLLGVGEALWRAELTTLRHEIFLAYQTYAALLLSVVMLCLRKGNMLRKLGKVNAF